MQSLPQPVWLTFHPPIVSFSICSYCKFDCCMRFCASRGKTGTQKLSLSHIDCISLILKENSDEDFLWVTEEAHEMIQIIQTIQNKKTTVKYKQAKTESKYKEFGLVAELTLNNNRKCCKGTFKASCLVDLRMLLQLTYCCLHNQCEYLLQLE